VQPVVDGRSDDLAGKDDGRPELDPTKRDAFTTLQRLAKPRPKAIEVGDRAQEEDGRPLTIAGAHEIADVDERLVPDEAHTAVVVDGDAHQL